MSDPATIECGELDRFLELLNGEGYRVGVRERLLASALLAQSAAEGRLPQDPTERLSLLEPLLSTNIDEQRKFTLLVTRFIATKPAYGGATTGAVLAELKRGKWPDWVFAPWLWWLAGIALLALLATLAAPDFKKPPTPKPPIPQPTHTTGPLAQDPSTVAEGITAPIYVPSGPFPVPEPSVQAGVTAARYMLGTTGALAGLSLAGWALNRLRRRLYLQGLRTDEELDERIFYDPDPTSGAPPLTLVRPVSRLLRQRVASSGTELDVAGTLRATLKNAGAFAPRFRSRRRTPEYIALIERIGAADQQAKYHTDLIAALKQQDVPIAIYYFDRTPALGCWPVDDTGKPREAQRTDFTALAARWEGQRLLVFADARVATDRLTGKAAPWVDVSHAFAARAWFSPHPIASWDTHETLLDELGFLVLPAQPEALDTLAKWLASDRAELAFNPAWPTLYPPMLRADPLGWAARQVAPPQEVVEALHFELRTYLGAERFQWLCACALFPALSWPLTLALGREFFADEARLAYGASALAALPWFRHGLMPHWLRESLVNRLDAQREAGLKTEIESRLSAAIEASTGQPLVTLAMRRRRLLAWLSRRTGLARDVVLVDFLHKGVSQRLAQRLPEPLRRLLFRAGNSLYGIRRRWIIASALAALFGALALPGVWNAVLEALGYSPLPRIARVATLEGLSGPVKQVNWSPDGELIVAVTHSGRASVFTAAGRLVKQLDATSVKSAGFTPDGLSVIIESGAGADTEWSRDGQERALFRGARRELFRAKSIVKVTGRAGVDVQVGENTPAVRLQGQSAAVTDIALHPNGLAVVTAAADGAAVWGQLLPQRVDIVSCSEGGPSRSVITAEAQSLANNLLAARVDFGSGAVGPVVMTALAWQSLRGRSFILTRGVIAYAERDSAQQRLAERLLVALQSKGVINSVPAWTLAQAAAISSVTLSVCDSFGAQDPAQQKAPVDLPLAQRPVGQVFKDCDDCPEMVVVPAGIFLMGSPASEQGRTNDEGPQHKVNIPRPLAIGRTEVTRAQYTRFVLDTGRKVDSGCSTWDADKRVFSFRADTSWNNPGFIQSEDHPVVCVNWDDAKVYTQWLAKKTGKKYRLLSEAEWEYAARAGEPAARYWGETFDPEGCKYANIADATTKKVLASKDQGYAECDDRQAYTAPVRSYDANKFGLHDMIGNAWEWTEDCWNDSYSGAPEKGEAWSKGDCGQRVLRGGSWYFYPDFARAANRNWINTVKRVDDFGLRLVRTD